MAWTERYVDASAAGGGTGTSAIDPWTFTEATTNSVAGMRVNFKAGTYNYSSTYTTTFQGSVTQSIWWRGYKTTPGDLDSKLVSDLTDSTDMPLIVFNNNYLILQSDYTHLTGMSFRQEGTIRPALYDRRLNAFAKNCRYRISNTAATSYSVCEDGQRDGMIYINCEFICDSTAHTGKHFNGRGYGAFFGCHFKGQGSGTGIAGAYSQSIQNCIFEGLNIGLVVNQYYQVQNSVFYDIADDAIQQTSVSSAGSRFLGNVFHSVTGYCLGSTVGTLSGGLIANNRYYNCPNVLEDIFENLQFDEATEASDPFVNAAAGDFTLKNSANGYGAGYGLVLGTSSTDYSDIGAIQHVDAGGGVTNYNPFRNPVF